jgi:hypothetical protein
MDIAERTLQLKQDFDEVYEAGKNAMWDAFTAFGKRSVATRAFCESDYTACDEMPYPFRPTGSCQQMFYNYRGKILPRPQYVDMSRVPTNSGDNLYRTFAYWSNGYTTEGDIPDYGIQAPVNYRYTYDSATAIKTIQIVRSAENTTYEGTFQKCSNLTHITFEGVIGRNISFSDCTKLSAISIKNIAEHLKDNSGTDKEYSYTLTLDSGAFAVVESEGATAEYNGVACTWSEYIDNKKWNLTLA